MSAVEETLRRIEMLRTRISLIRRVQAGDIVMSSDHNEVVSCLAEALDILSALPISKRLPFFTNIIFEDGRVVEGK